MGVIEMSKDHVSSSFELLKVVPASPVPCKPFKVLWIDQLELISLINFGIVTHVPIPGICSLPVLVLSPLNLMFNELPKLRQALCYHFVKENGANLELDNK